ncbi:MAG: 50S ribosomal protein L15 [Candidatus Omnitrophica bacterium]|nr:50S ribosomal protein L15 [Candidatus Omnitrophota bacterium]
MFLHEIGKPKGARKKKRIVGRGQGSGRGKTAGRGENGQKSRSGRSIIHGLEGGQMPLIRRLPKVGFRVRNPRIYQLVNLASLSKVKEGTVVSPEFLKEKGLIKSSSKRVKILGVGEVSKPLTVQVHALSKSAEEKIVKAGGKIEPIKKKI